MAVYDSTTPAIAQNDPWSCAPTSTRWGMTAYGRHPSEQWMESQMIADGIVSTELGLLDASGAGLAQWITAQYAEFGYAAYNNGHVSFDDVRSVAGQTPVLIGGRRWGHWSGCRHYDPATDTLQLANPASGWMGINQTMTRQQFADLGSFSMVVITWNGPAPAPHPPEPAPSSDWVVGPGLAEAMARGGELPASDEIHLGAPGRGLAIVASTIGRTWVWIDSLGQAVSYEGWKRP